MAAACAIRSGGGRSFPRAGKPPTNARCGDERAGLGVSRTKII